VDSDSVNPELIERAQGGDQAALGELLEKYRRYLWGLAERMLDDRAAARIDALDVVQQTCLSVHKQITEFQGHEPAQFAAWLRQIHERNIHNAARNLLHARETCHRSRAADRRCRSRGAASLRQPTASPQRGIGPAEPAPSPSSPQTSRRHSSGATSTAAQCSRSPRTWG